MKSMIIINQPLSPKLHKYMSQNYLKKLGINALKVQIINLINDFNLT